jgi:hypothetical protein
MPRLSTEAMSSLWHMFRSARCPVCAGKKLARQCFCRSCYFALPPALRSKLWISALEEEFYEAYGAAKSHLFGLGLGPSPPS